MIELQESVKMPSAKRDNQRWQAVTANDAAADGDFFYAVKTTGVYCRPSCSSRAPKRENVAFYATREAAERAGRVPVRRLEAR
ncbi:Ada metal-binding domain-containing protein [Salinisphaera sp.]|uniref:Ada metal-binding domain-containing protein n=1 Tax=Salinisphaera sp. TaxID=1914330 RepID=UPI002D7A0178|nr:Ada metal-binding domain-containing protein [Salinisphaera sp.]HET7314692.1 Ada metal-binding domain-containing protein [Salinisphaera sp.]